MNSLEQLAFLWTPVGSKHPRAGQIAVVCWPQEQARIKDFACHGGASSLVPRELASWSTIQCAHYLLSAFVGLVVRDGLRPEAVHKALSAFPEYRCALPLDVQ